MNKQNAVYPNNRTVSHKIIKKVLLHAPTQINLENIMRSGRSHARKPPHKSVGFCLY